MFLSIAAIFMRTKDLNGSCNKVLGMLISIFQEFI